MGSERRRSSPHKKNQPSTKENQPKKDTKSEIYKSILLGGGINLVPMP